MNDEEDKLYELCLAQVKHISQCKQEVCSGCPALARQLQADIEEFNASHDQQIALTARLSTEEMTLRYAIQILGDTDKEFALENLQRQLDKNIQAQENQDV